jgi:hypothetical protein
VSESRRIERKSALVSSVEQRSDQSCLLFIGIKVRALERISMDGRSL